MRTFLVNFVIILLLSSACAPKISPSVSPTLNNELVKPLTKEQQTWQIEWEDILANAKKERWLSIYTGEGGEVRTNLEKGFKNKYNINVNWTSGSPSEIDLKILNERKAQLYIADLYMAGAGGAPNRWKGKDIFPTMASLLILPEVKEPALWYQNRFPWFDSAHTNITHSGLKVNLVSINTQIVKNEEIKDLVDLLSPKWKGMIMMHDPTITGIGQTNIGMIGKYIMGWDFLKKLATQEPIIIRDNRLMVDWLAKSKYPIAIGALVSMILEYQNAGAPITQISIDKGTYISSGMASISLVNNAPHPNTTKIFLNWFLSKEGQYIYSKSTGYQSFRNDVPTDHINSLNLIDPKVKYSSSHTEEALALREEWGKKSKEIFGNPSR